MKSNYDHRPSVLEAVGNGSYLYRYDIQKIDNTDNEDNASEQWLCEEVTVWPPLSANKITEKVLTERFAANYEQKLVNEYNAAQLGLLTDEEAAERTAAYKSFLTERARLKALVDEDCLSLNL